MVDGDPGRVHGGLVDEVQLAEKRWIRRLEARHGSELREKRQAAIDAHDGALLKNIRRQLHHYNRQIRAHAK